MSYVVSLIKGKISSSKNITVQSLTLRKYATLENVHQKPLNLKTRIKPFKSNPSLKKAEVIHFLKARQGKAVLTPIDKAFSNFAIACKRYFTKVVIRAIGVIGDGTITYCKASKCYEEIVADNTDYIERLGVRMTKKEKTIASMHWIPHAHKNQIGACFIIASKLCLTKISNSVYNGFKLIRLQIEKFHKKTKSLFSSTQTWVLQNSEPIILSLNKINKKKGNVHSNI